MENQKNYNLTLGVIGLLAVVVVLGAAGWLVSRPQPPVIQGEAEATEYRVSGKVPGRIEALYVREGSRVRKGDTVALIDSPEIRAKLAQARAAKAAASAQWQKALNGAREEQRTGAYALWQQAQVGEAVMKKTLERMQSLFNQKVISAQQYDEIQARYEAAAAQARAAKSQYELAVHGAREEDRRAAAALVEQAQGALAEVESYLDELYLTAPSDGLVSAIFPHVGELVGTGAPIVSITDLSEMWFTFNVREDGLHGLRQGDRLRVRLPALDGLECTATVNYLAARESYATWKATKETDGYDVRTFEVRAVPDGPVDGLRPGMTVLLTERESGQNPSDPHRRRLRPEGNARNNPSAPDGGLTR